MSADVCNEPGCRQPSAWNPAKLRWCLDHWPENLAKPEPMVSVSYRADAAITHYVKCRGCGWQQAYTSGTVASAAAQAHKAAPHA